VISLLRLGCVGKYATVTAGCRKAIVKGEFRRKLRLVIRLNGKQGALDTFRYIWP